MKIYVAGKFEKKELILEIYRKIEAIGHSVAYDWTTHKPIRPYEQNEKIAARYSDNELQGICDSDVFIYLSDDKGHTLHMELGAALLASKKSGKPLILAVGQFNNVSPWLFNSKVRRVETIDQAIDELKTVSM